MFGAVLVVLAWGSPFPAGAVTRVTAYGVASFYGLSDAGFSVAGFEGPSPEQTLRKYRQNPAALFSASEVQVWVVVTDVTLWLTSRLFCCRISRLSRFSHPLERR
jgi:hypothetical protein